MNNPITKHYLILKDKKAMNNIAFTEEDADRLLDSFLEKGGPGDYYVYVLVKAKRNIIKSEEVEVKEQEPRIGEMDKANMIPQGGQIGVDEAEGEQFLEDEDVVPEPEPPDDLQRWRGFINPPVNEVRRR